MMEVTSVQWKGLASPPVEWCYRMASGGVNGAEGIFWCTLFWNIFFYLGDSIGI